MSCRKEVDSCDGLAPTSEDFQKQGCERCPKLFKDALQMLDKGIELTVPEYWSVAKHWRNR